MAERWRKTRIDNRMLAFVDFFFPCKVVNKILDHNSVWQITTQRLPGSLYWVLPHTKSLRTSPPAHALTLTLVLLQDIWWKDMLRWRRYMFILSAIANVSVWLKGKKRCGRSSSLTCILKQLSITICEGGRWVWTLLSKIKKWPVSQLSGAFFSLCNCFLS